MTSVAGIADALRGYRFVYRDEDDLQASVAVLLAQLGYTAQREARLSASCRIDLLVDRVGVEVKTAGTAATVGRQLRRYLALPCLDGVVLVTSRTRHTPALLGVDDPRLAVVQIATVT